ncbi:MAG: hypothetical protein PHE78_07220 [Candidatus Gastranaerophilales bacterium]|nr:hypothetical protein [Candidatus Gastranaerophilales bacterium]
MLQFFKENKINIFSFLCLLLTMLFFAYYFRYSVFIFDDYWACFAKKPFLSMLIQEADHGCYLSAFMMKLQGTIIPFALHIHPNDYNATYGAAFKGMVFFFIPYLTASVFYLNKKKDMLFISLLLFLTFGIFYAALCYDPLLFFGNLFFYRYIIYAAIYVFFLYWSLKRFSLQNVDLNCYDYLLFIVMGLLLGNSDILAPQIFIGVLLFSIFLWFENKKYLKLILPFAFSMVIGIFSFLLNPFFQQILKIRTGESSVFVLSRWENTLSNLHDFLNIYFKSIILGSSILILIFVLLFSVIAFMTKFKDKSANTKIIFSFCFLSSWFLYYFLLIYINPENSNTYFLNQLQLQFLFHLTFWLVIVLFLGIILGKLNPKNYLINTCALFLALSSFFFIFNWRVDFCYKHLLQMRYNTYKTEKIWLFLYKNNMPMVLPDSMLSEYYTAHPHLILEHYNLMTYLEIPDTSIPQSEIKKLVVHNSAYKDSYIKLLYNINLQEYTFSTDPKLLEKYKEKGLIMSEKELYSEPFTSLFSYYTENK